jgi:hypothetical protein
MWALSFAAFVFIAIFVAALVGFRCQRFLPETFTDDATEASVRSVLGMLSMLTAVVMGFVTADAKNSFDHAAKIAADTAVRLVSIDRVLANLGDQAKPLRGELKEAAQEWIDRIKSPEGDSHSDLRAVERGRHYEEIVKEIQRLAPTSEADAAHQARAVDLAVDIMHDRWMLKTERAASTPTVFLLVLLAWLALEFFIFGLFANPNTAITVATFLGAIMVASAFFIVLDLEGPMTGPMRISTENLERAVAIMGQ